MCLCANEALFIDTKIWISWDFSVWTLVFEQTFLHWNQKNKNWSSGCATVLPSWVSLCIFMMLQSKKKDTNTLLELSYSPKQVKASQYLFVPSLNHPILWLCAGRCLHSIAIKHQRLYVLLSQRVYTLFCKSWKLFQNIPHPKTQANLTNSEKFE